MNIPLIIPPAPYLTNPKALAPLGVLYIAGYVESRGDTPVVMDLAGIGDYVGHTINKLKEIECTCVGISATSGQIYYVLNIVKAIKKEFPHIKIIGGGAHFTHTSIAHKRIPQRTQHFIDDFNKYFDCYVLGDGELALYEAISTDKKVVDATIPSSPSYMTSDVISDLPFPARHLIDIRSYNYDFGCSTVKGSNAINIMSQRGCPYGCRFCSSRVDKYSRLVRKTAYQKTLDEIEYLYKTYGYTDIAIYDDELNVHPELSKFLDGFKDLQNRLGVKMRYRAFLKSNLCNDAQMKSLAEAGLTVAVIGGESGSERMLKNMAKKSTVEQNTRFVELCHKYNVHAKCIMSVGHPGETPDTLGETEAWLEKVQLEDVNFTIISCLPSSFYYDYAKLENGVWVYESPETGDKLYSVDVDFHSKPNILNGNLDYGYESTVWTDALSQDDLVKWHAHLENKFKWKKG